MTHGYFSGWWRARFNTAWAPTTRMRLRYWSPCFEIGPSFCLPPVEILPRYDPDPGRKVTTRSKNLRVRDGGSDCGRTHNANPRDAPEPLACFVRAMLSNDPPLDRSDHRLPRLKPRRQHDELHGWHRRGVDDVDTVGLDHVHCHAVRDGNEEPIFARLGCCAPQVADPLLRRHFSSLHSEAVAFDHGFKLFFQRRRRRHHRQTMFVRRNETHEFHHALDGNGTAITDGCLH